MRVELSDLVISSTGRPASGVKVTVAPVGGSGSPNLWVGETGEATLTAVTTGSDGSFSVWLDEGRYDVTPAGSKTKRVDLISQTTEALIQGGLPNAKTTFGAKGDGVTDDTAAIQAAVNSGFCWVPPGTYLVGKITIPSFSNLWGAGIAKTFFKLKAGVKDNLFESQNFAALVGGGAGLGPRNINLYGFTVDGNKAENAEPGANKGYGIALDAYAIVAEDIHIRNCGRDGWFSTASHEEEAASGAEKVEGSYESIIRNVRTYHNAINGFTFQGPSSSFLSDIMSYNNGPEGIGILSGGTTSYWVNCRSWGFHKYAWKTEGTEHMVNCSAEEGREYTLYVHDGRLKWAGGFIYNQGEPALALIKIGAAGHEAAEVQLEGFRSLYSGAGIGVSIDFENEGGNSRILGRIKHEPAHAATKGTPKETTEYDLKITGSTTTSPLKTPGEPWLALASLNAKAKQVAERLTLGARLVVGSVELRGQFEVKAAEEIAASTLLFSIPAGLPLPAQQVDRVAALGTGTIVLNFLPNGEVKSLNAVKAGERVKLDGLSYSV